MANQQPGFIFYPGDYLRDTQCISENVQVAYDRIMCEHMRNICISQDRLNFFTKKLSETERQELLSVLTLTDCGYQITWVAQSINKYNAFRASRSKNRTSKKDKDVINISETYVPHMESENEIDNVLVDVVKEKEVEQKFLVPQMLQTFLLTNKSYKSDPDRDYPELFKIATFYKVNDIGIEALLQQWKKICDFIATHSFYRDYNLLQVNRYIQTIDQELTNGKKFKGHTTDSAKPGSILSAV